MSQHPTESMRLLSRTIARLAQRNERANRLETAIARVIAEGKVRTYNMSGRRGDTDSSWRGRRRFHARRGAGHRRLRQFINQEN